MADGSEATYKPPTKLSEHYTALLVGFFVGVPLALLPLFSKVPGVESLLDLFPGSSRNTLISFSGFLLGGLAIVIEFLGGERPSPAAVSKYFRRALWPFAVGFVLLFVFYSLFVTLVPVEGGKHRYAFVLAGRVHGPPCGCAPTDRDIRCMQDVGVGNEVGIETCWDPDAIRRRTLLLHASYIVAMGGAGALVGAILLQRKSRREAEPLAEHTAPSR